MKTPSSDLPIVLGPRNRAKPTYRQLYAALREAILDGRLRPGVRLPSTRDLARRYDLARGTIVAAFEQMKAEGYLTGRTGSGTYVATLLPDTLLDAGPSPRSINATPPARRLSDIARRARAFRGSIGERARASCESAGRSICSRRRSGRKSPDDACGGRRRAC
jgi:GntR family transcriptional regulator/MocR family aminotransferase